MSTARQQHFHTDVTQQLMQPHAFSTRDRLHVGLDNKADYFVLNMFSEWVENGKTAKSGCSSKLHKWPTVFPQHKRDEHVQFPLTCYRVAMTDISAQLIRANFQDRPEQISFDPDARIAFDYMLGTCFNQQRCCQFVANYNAGLPCSTEILVNESLPLAPYQLIASQCALWSEGYALYMEQGTGKTATTVGVVCTQAAVTRERLGRPYRAIIVCPNAVRMGWQDEFKRFAPASCPVKCTVVRGDKIDRTKYIIDACMVEDAAASILIMSYGSVPSMVAALQQIPDILDKRFETDGKQVPGGWDLIALDESHMIKGYNTQRTKACLQLRDLARKRLVLTGTPIVNSINDLYAQLEFLGKGFSGFSTWDGFREFHNVFRIDEQGHRAVVAAQNVPFMQERLAKISYIVRKAEALPELPDKKYRICEVEMTPDQAAAYSQLANDMAVELEGEMNELDGMNSFDRAMTVNNILTRMLRLAQITSGFLRFDDVIDPNDGRVIRRGYCQQFNPNPKTDSIVELLGELEPHEKMIVWCNWTEDIRAVTEKLNQHGIKHVQYYGSTTENQREESKRRFNCEPDCRILVGNAAAGGAGLNLIGCPPENPKSLDTRCTTEVYFSQGWSPVLRSQSEDRAHRKGVDWQITIIDLCVPNSIDETIRERVMKKRIAAYSISDLREILTAVIHGLKVGV